MAAARRSRYKVRGPAERSAGRPTMLARCARCQQTFSTDRYGRQFCPLCGAEVFLRDPSAPPPPGATGAQPVPAEPCAAASPQPAGAAEGYAGAPWEDRGRRSRVAALVDTLKESMGQPGAFYSRLRPEPVGSAYSFGILCWVISSFIGSLWSAAQQAALGRPKIDHLPGNLEALKKLLEWQSPRLYLFTALGSPAFGVAGFFAVAAVLHLMVMLFCNGGRGWSPTVRALGYASGPLLLAIVPGCGSPIGSIWSIVLTIIGVMHLHRTTGGRAAAAVLTPILLMICCACAAVVLAAGVGMAAAAGGHLTPMIPGP